MKNKMVWAEVASLQADPYVATRIFRNRKDAFALGLFLVEMTRRQAAADIRRFCFLRSKSNCEICGAPVTWESGHLHEKQHRGKGGEMSIFNSVFICPTCHKHAHSDREPRWTRKDLTPNSE